MKKTKVPLHQLAKNIANEILLHEQLQSISLFQPIALEKYKENKNYLKKKIIFTKLFYAFIFAISPIFYSLSYNRFINQLTSGYIPIQLALFIGSFIFSVFTILQILNLLIMGIFNTLSIMSGEIFQWFKTLPISEKRLKNLAILTIFKSLDLPLIVMTISFPLINFLLTFDLMLLLINSLISFMNLLFSFTLLIIVSKKLSRIVDIYRAHSRKNIFIRLLVLFAFLGFTIGGTYLIQFSFEPLLDLIESFFTFQNSLTINLLFSYISFPFSIGYLPTIYAIPRYQRQFIWSGQGLFNNIYFSSFIGFLGYCILTIFLFTIARSSLKDVFFIKDGDKKSSYKEGKKYIIKPRSTVKAFLMKDLKTASRDLQVLLSFILPFLFSVVLVISYNPNLEIITKPLNVDLFFLWLLILGQTPIIANLLLNNFLSLEKSGHTILVSLPIKIRKQAIAKLIIITPILSLSVLVTSLFYLSHSQFWYFFGFMIGTLPIHWFLLILSFELRVYLFGKLKHGYTLDNINPEDTVKNWIIIFLSQYLIYFWFLITSIYLFMNAGIESVISFIISVYHLGLIGTFIIFQKIFPSME